MAEIYYKQVAMTRTEYNKLKLNEELLKELSDSITSESSIEYEGKDELVIHLYQSVLDEVIRTLLAVEDKEVLTKKITVKISDDE